MIHLQFFTQVKCTKRESLIPAVIAHHGVYSQLESYVKVQFWYVNRTAEPCLLSMVERQTIEYYLQIITSGRTQILLTLAYSTFVEYLNHSIIAVCQVSLGIVICHTKIGYLGDMRELTQLDIK